MCNSMAFLLLVISLIVLICSLYIVCTIDKANGIDNTRIPEIESYIHAPPAFETSDIPKADVALQYLLVEFHQHRDENAMLSIIKLYLFGLNPQYSPNKLIGLKIIQFVNDNSSRFSNILLNNCKVLWEQTSAEAYNDPDTFGSISLPENIVQRLSEALSYHDKNNVQLKTATTYEYPTLDEHDDIHLHDVVQNDIEKDMPEPRLIVKSDSQNVHNVSVPNSVKFAIDELEKLNATLPTLSFDDAFSNYSADLTSMSDIEDDVKVKAKMVLDSLTSSEHSKFNVSEKGAFTNVCNRIHHSQNKDSLIRILTHNMASGIEYDTVVCSTGKISRMISTFDAVDDEMPDIKPDWVIKQEIGSLAAKIREDVLNDADSNQRKQYESAGESPLSDKMRDDFVKEIKNRYVDVGILTDAAVSLLASEYLNEF